MSDIVQKKQIAPAGLPGVIVAASQPAPPGFTYIVIAPGVTLTVPPGTELAQIAVADFGGGTTVVVDAAEVIVTDGGTGSGASYLLPNQGIGMIRTWGFSAISGTGLWSMLGRIGAPADPTALPSWFSILAPQTLAMGTTAIVPADPGAPLLLPDAPTAYENAVINVRKAYAGAGPVIQATAGDLIGTRPGGAAASEDFSDAPAGAYWSYKRNGTLWALLQYAAPPFNDGQATLVANPAIVFDASQKQNALVVLAQAGHSFDFVAPVAGERGRLTLQQDGGGARTITSYTLNGGAGVIFPGGVAPVLSVAAGAIDSLDWYFDGTNVQLTTVGLAYS